MHQFYVPPDTSAPEHISNKYSKSVGLNVLRTSYDQAGKLIIYKGFQPQPPNPPNNRLAPSARMALLYDSCDRATKPSIRPARSESLSATRHSRTGISKVLNKTKIHCFQSWEPVLDMENLTFLFGLASILLPVCGDAAPQTGWKGAGAHELVCVLLLRASSANSRLRR